MPETDSPSPSRSTAVAETRRIYVFAKSATQWRGDSKAPVAVTDDTLWIKIRRVFHWNRITLELLSREDKASISIVEAGAPNGAECLLVYHQTLDALGVCEQLQAFEIGAHNNVDNTRYGV